MNGGRVVGVGAVTPLVIRGQVPVMSWVPQQLLPASDDTRARLLHLYHQTDARLAVALQERMRLSALGFTTSAEEADAISSLPPGMARVRAYAAETAGTAARFRRQALKARR